MMDPSADPAESQLIGNILDDHQHHSVQLQQSPRHLQSALHHHHHQQQQPQRRQPQPHHPQLQLQLQPHQHQHQHQHPQLQQHQPHQQSMPPRQHHLRHASAAAGTSASLDGPAGVKAGYENGQFRMAEGGFVFSPSPSSLAGSPSSSPASSASPSPLPSPSPSPSPRDRAEYLDPVHLSRAADPAADQNSPTSLGGSSGSLSAAASPFASVMIRSVPASPQPASSPQGSRPLTPEEQRRKLDLDQVLEWERLRATPEYFLLYHNQRGTGEVRLPPPLYDPDTWSNSQAGMSSLAEASGKAPSPPAAAGSGGHLAQGASPQTSPEESPELANRLLGFAPQHEHQPALLIHPQLQPQQHQRQQIQGLLERPWGEGEWAPALPEDERLRRRLLLLGGDFERLQNLQAQLQHLQFPPPADLGNHSGPQLHHQAAAQPQVQVPTETLLPLPQRHSQPQRYHHKQQQHAGPHDRHRRHPSGNQGPPPHAGNGRSSPFSSGPASPIIGAGGPLQQHPLSRPHPGQTHLPRQQLIAPLQSPPHIPHPHLPLAMAPGIPHGRQQHHHANPRRGHGRSSSHGNPRHHQGGGRHNHGSHHHHQQQQQHAYAPMPAGYHSGGSSQPQPHRRGQPGSADQQVFAGQLQQHRHHRRHASQQQLLLPPQAVHLQLAHAPHFRVGGGPPSQRSQQQAAAHSLAASLASPQLNLMHVVERGLLTHLAMDQHGSRFIQQKLETANPRVRSAAFEQLLPDTLLLCTDVFGNYVVQKFLEFGTAHQKRLLAAQMIGHVLGLSLQMFGCRVIQKAIDVADSTTLSLLVRELDGHVLQCVTDQNGNHVIQKCIERIPPAEIKFIVDAFRDQMFELSTHPYGCRVIQRLLEYCDSEQRQSVLEEILLHAGDLCKHQYGNYIVQHVLLHGLAWHRTAVFRHLRGKVLSLSRHKFASNVVEKCFALCTPWQRNVLLAEVLGLDADGYSDEGGSEGLPADEGLAPALARIEANPADHPLEACPLVLMVRDQFANYVVQTILDSAADHQQTMLIEIIRNHVPNLRKLPYGKHLVASIEKILGKPFQ